MQKFIRPWGVYQVLEDTLQFKIKRIEVKPQARLSYQRHQKRAEHWFVIQGQALVRLEDQNHFLKVGESIDIPQGAAHRIANPHNTQMLIIIEIQTGSYFGEDDIQRLADDFGRV